MTGTFDQIWTASCSSPGSRLSHTAGSKRNGGCASMIRSDNVKCTFNPSRLLYNKVGCHTRSNIMNVKYFCQMS